MSSIHDRQSAPRRDIGDLEFNRAGTMKVLAYGAVTFLSVTFWGTVACIVWAVA